MSIYYMHSDQVFLPLLSLFQEVELQMVTQYGSVEQLRYLLTSGVDVNMAGSVSGRST